MGGSHKGKVMRWSLIELILVVPIKISGTVIF